MHQMELADSKTQISVTGEVADDYAALLSSTNSISDAAAIVADALTRKLGKALSMPATDVDIQQDATRVWRRLIGGGGAEELVRQGDEGRYSYL